MVGLNSLPSIDEPQEASAACEKQRWWQKPMFIDFASNCVRPTFFFPVLRIIWVGIIWRGIMMFPDR